MSGYFKEKSQSLVEYAFILVIVGTALMGMQMYMKRGIQAVIKTSTDQLGAQQVTINSRKQASTISTTSGSRSGTVGIQVSTGGIQTRDIDTTDTSSGSSTSVTTTQ